MRLFINYHYHDSIIARIPLPSHFFIFTEILKTSMEKLHTTITIIFNLYLILYAHLCSLILPSSAYTLPDKYFINCGSDSNASLGPDRTFSGDLPYLVSPNKAVKSTSSSASSSLYQSARVFHEKGSSSYQFQIEKQGTYIIRLHFFVFSSAGVDFSDALFNVHASRFRLLSDFSVSEKNSLIIEEFLLTINTGKFLIDFIPSGKSSFAFVNAIEVFPAPESFIPDYAARITSAGSNGTYSELLTRALRKIYRINVGGPLVTAVNDSLWRNWIPDDEFLSDPETANNCPRYEGSLLRRQASEFIAPDHVYKTAKELKLPSVSNITWEFKVRKNSTHFVRVHFCDITGSPLGTLVFNLDIDAKFIMNISQYDITRQNASPFYFDFVVDSDDSGLMNVSMQQNNESAIKNVFLNGLEIMEIMERTLPVVRKTKMNRYVSIFGSLAAVLFLLIAVVVLLLILKFRRAKSAYRTSGRPFSAPLFGGSEKKENVFLAKELNLALKMSYVEIKRCTKNFNSKMLLGEGGFGKVYKGTLRGDVKVAVKRSEPGHDQGILEFQTEIMILSQIRHRHLVSLMGYCDERSEMILIYEFMEKGTLREHLYTSDDKSENYTSTSELSWEQRLKICIDSAKGLDYLHTGLARRIIHRDVKSTNILLNEDYVAKVADFGLSKSGPVDPEDNTGVKGSFGYLDPEYFMNLQLTEKSDVYSFGVVLLEILCARPVIIASDRREEVNLAEWGLLWQKKGELEKIVDPCLVGRIFPNSLRKFGATAEKCLRGNSIERPMMNHVLWDLEFALRLQQTWMHKEVDGDSMNNTSLELGLEAVHRLPSNKVRVEDDDSFPGGGGDSTMLMASGEFSQLRIDHGR
ncbi:probable receptor-like protein kinase At5g24010 [Mercurialis annua]|uniref:probable receptor-like protein kinase At5g24010 n=1 Tax=Mercurialis annua TaxID=3986 RepID=UPI0024ADD345|nr:probable receptor-like protein kinase At5g24010 [Mercurialis annua]